MAFGYWGEILRIDLGQSQISIDRHSELFYRTYMGGACLGAYYLLKELPRNVDPFSAGNILVFAPSVLTGTPAPGCSRYSVVSKSPLTGRICDSQAGGSWGPELKFAGFDAIVIQGKAPEPVYIWICDGEAEIRDAGHIWGSSTGEAQAKIREELTDDNVRVALIGPAGEKLVRFACILSGLRHVNGRGGLGAVMGSKNLKAVAVRGHKEIAVKDAERVAALSCHFGQRFMENPANRGLHELGTAGYIEYANADGQLPTRNFQTGYFEQAHSISGKTMNDTVVVGTEACWACPVSCKRLVQFDSPYSVDPAYGGPESEALAALGSNCGISDLAAVCKGHELCNKLGLDVVSTGAAVAFAMECYEKNILTPEDTYGIDLHFGNAEAMVEIVEAIAMRKGLGNLLADGVLRAAKKLGKNASRFAMHTKGLEMPMHEPRVKGMVGLSYAVSPIGADHIVAEHDSDFDFRAPEAYIDQVKPLGLLERLPTESIDSRKVRMFCYLQQHFSFMDSLCLCIACFAPVRTFTMGELVDLVTAVTGWETSLWEIMKLGERRINMFRAFNAGEDIRTHEDWLPERMFEPIGTGPRAGYRLSEEGLDQAISLYYEMMNWDETGVPRAAKLLELGLGWIKVLLSKDREQQPQAKC